MNLRELLEKVANVSGKSLDGFVWNGEAFSKGEERWNPLTTNSDAEAIAARLGFYDPADSRSEIYKKHLQEGVDDHGMASDEAHRRAIVQAALASLG